MSSTFTDWTVNVSVLGTFVVLCHANQMIAIITWIIRKLLAKDEDRVRSHYGLVDGLSSFYIGCVASKTALIKYKRVKFTYPTLA
jgi:hypothetical protein